MALGSHARTRCPHAAQAGDDGGPEDAQDVAAPETAAAAQQAPMGRSGAHDQRTGAPAPQQARGGGAEDASQPQPQPQRQPQQRRPEPNPLRSLGDTMERWKANLAIQQDALPQGGPAAHVCIAWGRLWLRAQG